MISNPPINDQTLLQTGRFTTPWKLWFQTVLKYLNGGSPIQLYVCTLATLPPAQEGQFIYVRDASGGPTTAFSDGTDWYIEQGTLLT